MVKEVLVHTGGLCYTIGSSSCRRRRSSKRALFLLFLLVPLLMEKTRPNHYSPIILGLHKFGPDYPPYRLGVCFHYLSLWSIQQDDDFDPFASSRMLFFDRLQKTHSSNRHSSL